MCCFFHHICNLFWSVFHSSPFFVFLDVRGMQKYFCAPLCVVGAMASEVTLQLVSFLPFLLIFHDILHFAFFWEFFVAYNYNTIDYCIGLCFYSFLRCLLCGEQSTCSIIHFLYVLIFYHICPLHYVWCTPVCFLRASDILERLPCHCVFDWFRFSHCDWCTWAIIRFFAQFCCRFS